MNKTSLLIQNQLPEFIRSDISYSKFVSFLEAYYEWMELEKGVIYETNSILQYANINETLEEYIRYFYNIFLPSFPQEVLADKRKLIKFSKSMNESKGNVASFKFLFKVLYDVDPEIIETKEFVLKASAGKWFLPKSLKLKSNDASWVNSEGLWVFGIDSKSLAKIERAKIVNDKVDVYISDIERLFQTGEFVKVVDRNLQDVLFLPNGTISGTEGSPLQAKLLGTISNIDINPNYRGNYYLQGDPVVVFGGMEDEAGKIGAEAEVLEVTSGSIQRVVVNDGSWGYRPNPNTLIYVTPDSGNPIVEVGDINPANTIYISMVQDSLELKKNISLNCNTITGFPLDTVNSYNFIKLTSNSIISNANTVMGDSFTYSEFPTYSIDTVLVRNGGGGFRSLPTVHAESVYETDLPLDTNISRDPRYYNGRKYNVNSITNFGILAPITLKSSANGAVISGNYYEVGDIIVFSGGIGGGAYANVVSVVGEGNFGPIESISYQTNPANPESPLGGYGYSTDQLPSLSIKPKLKTGNTTNGSYVLKLTSTNPFANIVIGQSISGNGISLGTLITNTIYANNSIVLSSPATETTYEDSYYVNGRGAELVVNSVLGDGSKLTTITDRVGSITSVKILNYGEDYESNPKVSLRVQDIAVTGLQLTYLPEKGDLIYQGEQFEGSSYNSRVHSVKRITYDSNPTESTFIMTVYNYTKYPDINSPLILQKNRILEGGNTFPLSINTGYIYPDKILSDGSSVSVGIKGVLSYGDGTAKANSKFLNGLILGQGRYIDESHQPSSYSLLQNENYNNFTYIVSVEKEIAKYREMLYSIVHPAGTKSFGQTILKSEAGEGTELIESTIVKQLDDYEFIWALLATEETEDNEYSSEIIRFPESNTRYSILSNNSSEISISSFPEYVTVGKNIYGDGLPNNTKIESIDLLNSSIIVSNSATTTQNSKELLLTDFWTGNTLNYVVPSSRIVANTVEGSNVISISTTTSTVQNIIKNQIVYCEPTTIYANTTNGSNLLVGVEDVSDIYVGQYVTGNNIPKDTRVVSINSNTNTIQLSANTTANSNGVNYSHYDFGSGEYIPKYKYNYVQFSGLPYNTRVKDIVFTNNSITLTSNYIGQNTAILHFLGDGFGGAKDSDYPSSFARVETSTLTERDGTEPFTTAKEKYFSYNDYLVAIVDGEEHQLITEDEEPVIATIYIKTK